MVKVWNPGGDAVIVQRFGLNVPVGTVATVAGCGPSLKCGDSAKVVQVPTVSLEKCKQMNILVGENNLCIGHEQIGKTFCGVASCTFFF